MTNTTTPLCVFAKPARPGRVKTRLAADVGAPAAAALARAFFADTWALARSLPWAHPIAATTDGGGDHLPLEADAEVWLQGAGDLGARIERVLARGIARFGRAVAIGADLPGLPPDRLDAARRALAHADAVLGPADDGGFYLIGLNRCPAGILAELAWSRSDTLAATRARLEARGLRVAIIAPWFDIDRPADLPRLRRLLLADRTAAPATARLIAPTLSVVIPALDEARRLGATLRAAAQEGVDDIWVVDGGSSDDTAGIARAGGARVITAPRGRASQLNAGAAAASGEVLLFLHADAILPADATWQVARTLLDPAVVAGAFRTWTVPDRDRPIPWYAPLYHLADLRSRYTRRPYGDQAPFVRNGVFRRAGGFPAIPLMEDLELARRLARYGRIAAAPARVEVSARRFAARPLYYFALMNLFPLLYRAGVPPAALARLYGEVR